MTVDTKIYQDSTLALGASDLIYVSRPDGSADGKADLTALSAIVHGVNGALYVAAGSLATVATTGAYSDLTGLPTLFSGAYADLTGKPTLFDGAFSSLTGKPTTLSGYGITDAQPLDTELTALAGLTSAADTIPYFTGSGTATLTTFTTAGRALVDDADAVAQRATLGLGSIATQSAAAVAITGGAITGITDLTVADGGTGVSTLTAHGVLLGNGASAINVTAAGTSGQKLKSGGSSADPTWADDTATIAFVIDGGGSTITTGVKGDLEIPFGCTITAATLLADQSGSIVVNVWKDTYANYPPTVADKITASAPPTITTATNSQDTTLTGWTTSISAGDTLRFNVDSVTTIQRVTLSLKVKKT